MLLTLEKIKGIISSQVAVDDLEELTRWLLGEVLSDEEMDRIVKDITEE